MTRGQVWRATLVGTSMLLLGGVAAAQTTPVKPQPTDPNMPSTQNTVPDKVAPRAGETTGSTGSLSDRLGATDGVIRPSDPGTGRTIVPSDPGTTPVIPPAGTPGSAAPNVEPK